MYFFRIFPAFILVLLITGCHPRIYQFSAAPVSVGLNDRVQLNWSVKGTALLLVHDVAFPAGNVTSPVNLEIIQTGKTDTLLLGPNDTVKLGLKTTGSLSIRSQLGLDNEERLRSVRLIASQYGKDSVRDIQMSDDPCGAGRSVKNSGSIANRYNYQT